jgi:hypothetical protein
MQGMAQPLCALATTSKVIRAHWRAQVHFFLKMSVQERRTDVELLHLEILVCCHCQHYAHAPV